MKKIRPGKKITFARAVLCSSMQTGETRQKSKPQIRIAIDVKELNLNCIKKSISYQDVAMRNS